MQLEETIPTLTICRATAIEAAAIMRLRAEAATRFGSAAESVSTLPQQRRFEMAVAALQIALTRMSGRPLSTRGRKRRASTSREHFSTQIQLCEEVIAGCVAALAAITSGDSAKAAKAIRNAALSARFLCRPTDDEDGDDG